MKLVILPFGQLVGQSVSQSDSQSLSQKMCRHVVWCQDDFIFIIHCFRTVQFGPLLL